MPPFDLKLLNWICRLYCRNFKSAALLAMADNGMLPHIRRWETSINCRTIAAIASGAEVMHLSVTGTGERAGNTPLEDTVMALLTLLRASLAPRRRDCHAAPWDRGAPLTAARPPS